MGMDGGGGWILWKVNSEIDIQDVGWGLFLGAPVEERRRNRIEQRENSELPMSEHTDGMGNSEAGTGLPKLS